MNRYFNMTLDALNEIASAKETVLAKLEARADSLTPREQQERELLHRQLERIDEELARRDGVKA